MSYYPILDYSEMQADDLCDYIVSKHHAYTRHALTVIEELIIKVSKENKMDMEELKQSANKFFSLKVLLLNHFQKEETVLFPFIKKMIHIKNGEGHGCFPLGVKVDNPLKIMSKEHDGIIAYLNEIRLLNTNYSTAFAKSFTQKLCYAELIDLEQDLHKHFYLEEKILHPKQIELGNLIEDMEAKSKSMLN